MSTPNFGENRWKLRENSKTCPPCWNFLSCGVRMRAYGRFLDMWCCLWCYVLASPASKFSRMSVLTIHTCTCRCWRNQCRQNRNVLHSIPSLTKQKRTRHTHTKTVACHNFLNKVFFVEKECCFFIQNKGHVTHFICIINAHEFIFERDVQLMNDDTCG